MGVTICEAFSEGHGSNVTIFQSSLQPKKSFAFFLTDVIGLVTIYTRLFTLYPATAIWSTSSSATGRSDRYRYIMIALVASNAFNAATPDPNGNNIRASSL